MTDTAPVRSFDATGDDDPDIQAGERVTVLDELRQELAELDVRHETFDVPARPGYAVRYRATIRYEQLTQWRKPAVDKAMPAGINQVKYFSIILANCCEAIIRQGTDLTADGEPLTFASDDFKELVGADRASTAVRKFYGRDGDLTKAALDLLEAAGYSDSDTFGDELEGPTDG